MLRLYQDSRMNLHVPPPSHPERPERLTALLHWLEKSPLKAGCSTGNIRPATVEELLRVQNQSHLAKLQFFESRGGGQIEADTWMNSGSIESARLAAGACVEAVEGVVNGPERRAFCIVRPPGHHARPDSAMGFCFFNSIAVAARHATEKLGLERVLIVDWDVHHGNGTQEIFYDDPRVAFFSIHRFPFYPGTGREDETGTGDGLGFTKNMPMRFGTPRKEFLAAFQSSLGGFADRVKPELILLSAGFDAHKADPVGNLGLESEDFEELTEAILAIADMHSGGKIVSVLEGGYNVLKLVESVEAHLGRLAI
ncbi:MAG: histone deacetylase family protein [Isosphaeraceae bacterium]